MWFSSYDSLKAVKLGLLILSCIKCTVLILESWFNHQEVNVVLLFGLEGLSNDPSSILVLPTSQGNAVDLQDDVTHLQLAAVVSRSSFLSTGIWREGRKVFDIFGKIVFYGAAAILSLHYMKYKASIMVHSNPTQSEFGLVLLTWVWQWDHLFIYAQTTRLLYFTLAVCCKPLPLCVCVIGFRSICQ